jgi:excisionase family DNA binding protein
VRRNRAAPEPDGAERRRAVARDGAVSVISAAKFVGAGRTFIYHEMRAGRLPFARIGRKRVIPLAALRSYLEARIVERGRCGRDD